MTDVVQLTDPQPPQVPQAVIIPYAPLRPVKRRREDEDNALALSIADSSQEGLTALVVTSPRTLNDVRMDRKNIKRQLSRSTQQQSKLRGNLDAANALQLQILVPGKHTIDTTRRFRITIPGVYDLGWRQSQGHV